MRKLLQYLLQKPLTWIGNKLAASPKKNLLKNPFMRFMQLQKK